MFKVKKIHAEKIKTKIFNYIFNYNFLFEQNPVIIYKLFFTCWKNIIKLEFQSATEELGF
ncbi:hypothetical protein D0X99_15210 [Algoriphagus lacus]|uniref:Uncharacterized protein n=1 Tax=Algoriphagus lacus TaxID=2056311 RepID=A0A418PNJ7_9BACT|nr:hypothetical protein D0X99_15210 [Algoriphagus lacus]